MTTTAVSPSVRIGTARLLPRRDRSWRDTRPVRGVGGIAPPDLERLRDELRALGGSPFLRVLDLERGTVARPLGADLDAFCAALVVADPRPAAVGLDSLVTQLAPEPLAGLPFRLTVGPDWAALHYSHALGDGRTMWPVLCSLVSAGLPPALAPRASARLPLARALLRTFAVHPARAYGVVRGRRAALPVPPGVAGAPPARVVTRRLDARLLAALRAERDRTCPEASLTAMLIARAMGAAREQGLATYPGFTVLADARRYLPSGARVVGNFSAGSYLEPDDPTDAVMITRQVRDLVDSGRPLLSMAMSARHANARPTGWADDPAGRALISFSHAGRLAPPATSRADRLQVVTLGRPLGVHGISLNLAEIGERLHVSATFHPDAQPAADVEHLLDTLVAPPLDLGALPA